MKRSNIRFDPNRLPSHPYAWHIARWLLNLLVNLEETRDDTLDLFMGLERRNLLAAIGMEDFKSGKGGKSSFTRALQEQLKAVRKAGPPQVAEPHAGNLKRLRKLTGMNRTDAAILMFLSAYHTR